MKLVPISSLRSPRLLRALLAGAAASLLATFASAAVTWHDVQFGGFASQGFLINTGHNDYLGESSDGTFDFREYAANASYSVGKFRVGAQAFGQKLGSYGNDEIKLDWATVDYQAAQWFGVRAGRVKMPRGLYNEALDLDSVRPFVLLPQSVYDNRLRDFDASIDGGMLYGNVGLHSAGSFDYRAYYGKKPLSVKSGASDYFNTDAPFANKEIRINAVMGGTAFWNTPINGLKAGYSFTRYTDFETVRFVPFRNAYTHKLAPRYDRHLLSAEYSHGDWLFAAEAGRENVDYDVSYPPAPVNIYLHSKYHYYYASAARRINRWLELGTYYSYSNFSQVGVNTPVTFPDLKQGDFAVSARFDLTEHLLFKLEGHYMDGAGKIFDLPTYSQPVAKRDNSWTMIAAKMTYSF